MMRLTIAIALSAYAVATAGAASCSDMQDCGSCLSTPFCGWCSRDTVMHNGTAQAQCQYVSAGSQSADWTCPAVFSHGTCRQGWDCVPGDGCKQAAAGHGQYNSKAECEQNSPDQCKKPKPSGLTRCNTKTDTCEPCTDYCSSDKECVGKGSFCQNGLCHGSTCQSNSTCGTTCSADTPDILIGTWRGLQIQSGFGSGEYDMLFQSKHAGPQVLFKDASGALSSGSLQSDAASQGRHLTLQFSEGPMQGSVLNGAYDAWEPSDETEQMGFYFGAPGDDAPADIQSAMNGTGQTVYVMSRCGHGATDCTFDDVFASAEVAPMFLEVESDPCAAATECGSCVSNGKAHCFWCPDGPVHYLDGTKGTQCAGFDPAGVQKDWVCSKGATQTCPAPPPAPEAMFSCSINSNGPTCFPCKAAQTCSSDKDCGDSYCQGGVCHGSAPDGCVTKAACGELTKNNCKAANETYAVCDAWTRQCRPALPGAPGAVSKYECEHSCAGAKVTGTYRAIAVSSKFMRGEYDFTFYDDASMHWSAPDGSTSVASLKGSEKVAVQGGAVSVEATVTKSSDPKLVGTKLYMVVKRDEEGNDGIAKFMFQGMDTAPVADFGAAMGKSEWVMVACKEGRPCDFSSAAVKA